MSLDNESRQQLRRRFAGEFNRESPAYGRIAAHILEHDGLLDIYDHVERFKHRPVSLFAAVHYLVLKGPSSARLARMYATPESHEAIEEIGPAFEDFVEDHRSEVRTLMAERSVQTNEVNRCVGLLPALMYVERSVHRPLSLIDLGASAGLNLLFDRYRYDYEGGPVIGPPGAAVRLHSRLTGRVPAFDGAAPLIEHRVGADLSPVALDDPDEELWLRACVWVGQVARDQRLSAALELARREWPVVRRGDAVSMLPRLGQECPEDTELCIFTSWLMGWMSQPEREALARAVAELGRTRSVWWVSFENAGMVPGLGNPDTPADASVLGLEHFEPNTIGPKERRILGTIHHHGNWLDWTDAATSAW